MARRVRVSGRFYLIVTALVVVTGVIVTLILSGRNAGVVRAGTMKAEMDTTAVFIRDEMCISTDKYDRITFYADEGAAVNAGDEIALVCKWGYSDDMMQSLLTVEGQIYSAQTALLAGVENADLAALELQISQKRAAIRDATEGEGDAAQDMLSLQRELSALLVSRAQFLRDTVQPTSALTELYATETERTAQLDVYRQSITAPQSGVVSFYFDSYEQILNKDKLSTVNASLVSSVASGASDLLSGASGDLVYRLVNPKLWYVAFVTSRSEGLRLSAGQRYTITFDELPGVSYTGTAMSCSISDGGVLNILEFTDDIGSLLCTRKLKASVTADMDGYIVPTKYVTVKDGIASVAIDGGDAGEYSVEVEVLAVDGEETLVRAVSANGSLSAGMRCVKP